VIKAAELQIDLLEFMLRWRTLQQNIHTAAAVTRWSQYVNYQAIAPEEYLKLRSNEGHIVDPIVHMHEAHGAEIKALIANYRPQDVENKGYGVLVQYELESRLIESEKIETPQYKLTPEKKYDEQLIKSKVIAVILNVLGKEKSKLFARR